jgi:hypothetical protein
MGKKRVYGAMRANRVIPQHLGRKANNIIKGQPFFAEWVIGLIQIWKDKLAGCIISTINESKLVNLGKNGTIIMKPNCTAEYNKHERYGQGQSISKLLFYP